MLVGVMNAASSLALASWQVKCQPPSLDFSRKCLINGICHRRIVTAVKKELTTLSDGDHEGDGSRPNAVNNQGFVPAPHAPEFSENGGFPGNLLPCLK